MVSPRKRKRKEADPTENGETTKRRRRGRHGITLLAGVEI